MMSISVSVDSPVYCFMMDYLPYTVHYAQKLTGASCSFLVTWIIPPVVKAAKMSVQCTTIVKTL